MGQKVNPHGMRVGVIKDWDSRWYAEADFADNLIEDHKIRTYLKKRLYSAGVPEETAKEALRLAMHKLPCKCKIASKADLEGGDNSEN